MGQQNELNEIEEKEIEELLNAFEPTPSACDSASVLYEAGFRAGVQSVSQASRFNSYLALSSGVFATALSVLLVVVVLCSANVEKPTLLANTPQKTSPVLARADKSSSGDMPEPSNGGIPESTDFTDPGLAASDDIFPKQAKGAPNHLADRLSADFVILGAQPLTPATQLGEKPKSYLKIRTEVLASGVEALPTYSFCCKPPPTAQQLHDIVSPSSPTIVAEFGAPVWFDLMTIGGR